MNLEVASDENLQYILNEIGEKLSIANDIMLNGKDYDLEKYDELKFLYDFVSKKGQLSPSESEAFIDELRSIRKS